MQTRTLRYFLVGVTTGLGWAMPRPAAAQLLSTAWRALDRVPDPRMLPSDILRERLSERRIQRDQVRLQEDISRGDATSVNHDLRRLQHDEVWNEHLRWEIQRDSLHLHIGPDPIFTQQRGSAAGLIAHPQYPGYGYTAADPTRLYLIPQSGPIPATPTARGPKVPITIRNAAPAGAGVDFTIDGTTRQAASGQSQQLDVGPTSEVTYDRGGSLGVQRYSLSAGTYEFRPSDAGWALYKLPPAPTPVIDPK